MSVIASLFWRPLTNPSSVRSQGVSVRLKQYCWGKGFIKIGEDFKSIKILQLTKEVKRLQQLFEKAGIRGVERTVLIKPTTEP